MLSEIIDSSFASEDHISTVLYLFIAHFAYGLEDKYIADIASVFQAAGCFRISDSLYRVHIDANPRDFRAIGNHALLLAQYWKFTESRQIIQDNIGRFRGEGKTALQRDLGLVMISEFVKNGNEKALSEAFEAFRRARFGSGRSPTVVRRGVVELKVAPVEQTEPGKYRFTVAVEHAAGSDIILLSIRGRAFFGREMNAVLREVDHLQIERLFGDIYLAPGDKLYSEVGAFEIIGDLGEFAPFYDGGIELELEAIFPDGSKRTFKHPQVMLTTKPVGLNHITSELFYGNGEWALSLMESMNDTGAALPPLWRESAYLATALEDSTQWVEAVEFVDSLLNLKIYPNLWVYRGALDYLLGNYVSARHPLQQAIESDPNNYWAYHNLALVEYELGNLERAAELFIKTAQMNPEMSPDFILAGLVYENLGQDELALRYLRAGHNNSAFRSEEVKAWIRDLESKLGIITGDN